MLLILLFIKKEFKQLQIVSVFIMIGFTIAILLLAIKLSNYEKTHSRDETEGDPLENLTSIMILS